MRRRKAWLCGGRDVLASGERLRVLGREEEPEGEVVNTHKRLEPSAALTGQVPSLPTGFQPRDGDQVGVRRQCREGKKPENKGKT